MNIFKKIFSNPKDNSKQKFSATKFDALLHGKLRLVSVYNGGSGTLPADTFWEVSNSISEEHYDRMPADTAYDNALNASIGKMSSAKKKITHFEPFALSKGHESFILEDGERVIRGGLDKVLSLCEENKTYSKKNILKSAASYQKKSFRIVALAYGKAGVWNFAGFAVFEDPLTQK